MQVCLENFQDMAAPLRVKMYPLVDFDSSESAIQFALLYPSRTGGSKGISFGVLHEAYYS